MGLALVRTHALFYVTQVSKIGLNMLYANGIQLPSLNALEAYQLVGFWSALMDGFMLLIGTLFLGLIIATITSTEPMRTGVLNFIGDETSPSGKRKSALVIACTLLIALLSISCITFFFNPSEGLAHKTMVLDHYSAQVPEGGYIELPAPDQHSRIDRVLVTGEDGRITHYETVYAVMDQDGFISLNINTSTNEKLSLVPLDEVTR